MIYENGHQNFIEKGPMYLMILVIPINNQNTRLRMKWYLVVLTYSWPAVDCVGYWRSIVSKIMGELVLLILMRASADKAKWRNVKPINGIHAPWSSPPDTWPCQNRSGYPPSPPVIMIPSLLVEEVCVLPLEVGATRAWISQGRDCSAWKTEGRINDLYPGSSV